METTVQIATPLLQEARSVARAHGTTVRALVEHGLRLALQERKVGIRPFRLRDASTGGKGLHPDAGGRSWDELRALGYEGIP